MSLKEKLFFWAVKSTAKQAAEVIGKKMADNPETNQGQQQNPTREATGKGGSLINITNILKPTSRGSFFFWVIVVLIILLILWYFNIWRASFYYAGLIIWIGFIAWGFVLGFRAGEKDRATYIFIATALLVWLLDMVPPDFPVIGWLLGQPYGGFEINLSELATALTISLPLILTSGITFAFLYVNMVFNIIKKEYISFLLGFSFILITNSLMARFFPRWYDLNIPIPYGHIGFLVLIIVGFGVAIFLDIKYFGARILKEIPNFFTYLFMIFVFSFFWINSGWMINPRAWIHAIYIIFFGFVYIMPKEKENPVLWHILIPSLLIVDFFGYGFLLSTFEYEWVKFIPTFIVFVLTYCYQKTENVYALTSFIVLVTVILALSIQVYGYEAGGFPFKQKPGTDLKDFLGTLGDKLRGTIEERLDIATAGLYRGSVEKNRYESLGVYFANIRAADPRFYQEDPITVWGAIRSKTYKDAVIINFSCYRWKDNKKIRADKIIPDIKFPIFTLEEVDTECTFLPKPKNDPLEIPAGSNIITFSAEYNFGTDAYLKAYFMDRDRFRAYARENVDPFTEFGIKDKNPSSVSTNGPVEIGMSTGQQPITVSEGYAVKPAIGITLTNRKEIQDKDKKIITRWEGKIKNITELILLVPPSINLPNIESCKADKNSVERLNCPCSMPFVEYDADKCKNTCVLQVSNPCKETCFSSYKNEKERNLCNAECDDNADTCIKECDHLFQVETGEGHANGKYRGYALDIGSLEFKDLNKDIDKHRSFSCRFDPLPSILDNTPITTRYFRVRARYNYLLENSVTVNVEKPITPVAIPTIPYDFDIAPYEEFKVPQIPYPGYPSNTDIDQYFRSKGSVLEGIGQCIKDAESETKVPALVVLSIANLESDKSGGQWTRLSGLAQLSYALFGIKCAEKNDEYVNKYCTFFDKRQCCKGYAKTGKDIIYEPGTPNVYRAYPNYCESVRDFGRLISTSSRYRTAMIYANNPEEMIRKIREAGYATDPDWANLVIGRMRIVKRDIERIGTVVT